MPVDSIHGSGQPSLDQVLKSIQSLELHMEKRFQEQQANMEAKFKTFESELQQFNSREAIHADAVLRNKVEIMWKVMTLGSTVIGTAILGALITLIVKTT